MGRQSSLTSIFYLLKKHPSNENVNIFYFFWTFHSLFVFFLIDCFFALPILSFFCFSFYCTIIRRVYVKTRCFSRERAPQTRKRKFGRCPAILTNSHLASKGILLYFLFCFSCCYCGRLALTPLLFFRKFLIFPSTTNNFLRIFWKHWSLLGITCLTFLNWD